MTIDRISYEFTSAAEQAALHLDNMADVLERAAKDIRARANDVRTSALEELTVSEDKRHSHTWAMNYYSFAINSYTNIQSNLRLDLVPNYTASLVLTRPRNRK